MLSFFSKFILYLRSKHYRGRSFLFAQIRFIFNSMPHKPRTKLYTVNFVLNKRVEFPIKNIDTLFVLLTQGLLGAVPYLLFSYNQRPHCKFLNIKT